MPVKKNPADAQTLELYKDLYDAYGFLNRELIKPIFGYMLPGCQIITDRNPKTKGYFRPSSWYDVTDKDEKSAIHELALNPELFFKGKEKEVISTLAHEMIHLAQEIHGKPGKGGYHNQEWAQMMHKIGLPPVSIDKPGKEVGNRVTHKIDDDGPYADCFAKLKKTGWRFRYAAKPLGRTPRAKAKRASKTKFTCPNCGQNAWAKPDANLICGDCHEADGEVYTMEPQESPQDQANYSAPELTA